MSMLMSESRLKDMGERIDAVVSGGDADSILTQPDDVIAECARRYIVSQMKLRERATSRSREATEKFETETSNARARLRAKANLITTELANSLHEQWTAAMLAGEFALPDGTRVSWADASVAQHNLRATQLEGLAAGDLATASIHRRAINDLRAAGVATLGELP